MAKLVLITMKFANGSVPYEAIAAKVGRAKDWARFQPSSWLIWTDLEPQEWFDRLSPLIEPSDTLFVVEIARHWKGQLDTKVAQWMERDRSDDMNGD